MSVRRPDDGDPDFASRPSNLVDSPEHYQDWRAYAFSSAPELTDTDPRPHEEAPSS